MSPRAFFLSIGLLCSGGLVASVPAGELADGRAATLQPLQSSQLVSQAPSPEQGRSDSCQKATRFLVLAGGGAPSYNEIALEKNVLYFQRTLRHLGYDPAQASTFFANGLDGQASIRYIDDQRQERFKVPEIPHLLGAATPANLQNWIQDTAVDGVSRPLFFYFTGHGGLNRENIENNSMFLWGDQSFTVQQLAQSLDQLPADEPVVTMMAQCFSGSFANFIYEDGIPERSLALQTRCGFFATVKTNPSVGCTPEVNEADYQDYSSSFFAGLSGQNRIGQSVPSADYNGDGSVAYAEAHAYAKVDSKTTDLPVSTVEVWLQEQAETADLRRILTQPVEQLLQTARPEQKEVVTVLAGRFQFDTQQSFVDHFETLEQLPNQDDATLRKAYLDRLRMELTNIGMEQQIRADRDAAEIAILDRLINCEAGTWQQVQKEDGDLRG